MLTDVAARGATSFDRLRMSGFEGIRMSGLAAEHTKDSRNHERQCYGSKERKNECQLHR